MIARPTIVLLLGCLLFSRPAFAEAWACEYRVSSGNKIIKIERLADGFAVGSEWRDEKWSVVEETDEQLTLASVFTGSVFVLVLDKARSEFVQTGIQTPEKMRRARVNPDDWKFIQNSGSCVYVK